MLKEKEKKEKAEKNIFIVADAKEAFRKECLQHAGQYDVQRLTDFYYYWSEENEKGKMRFECERYWNIDNRLKRWMTTRYSVDNTAAAIRLSKLKKQQVKEQANAEQQRAQAAQREQADAEREAQAERDRQLAGGLEEQIAANPDGFLARVQRERQKREGKK